ncbi:uncharacterized protein LOC144601281 [Rhinoraja longicauda]
MESEAVDSCIQRSLSALYPPFEETAATLLAQVFDVLEKTYQHDALRYIIDFFMPAKHILQTIQQQACEPYGGRRFAHAGWPLCQRGLVVVQLAALDWRQLRPGDFYLQLAPRQAGRGARLLLRWPGPEGPGSEPVPEASYPHLFTAEWLDGVNRRLALDNGGRGGGLEWCLAAEGGRLKRLPWRRVVYPLLEPEDGPVPEPEAEPGPGPRPPAIGTRRRPSGDGADAEPRSGAGSEAGLKRSLGNGKDWSGDNDAPDGEVSTYCSVTACGVDHNDGVDLQDGDEGEYVELLEASAHARGCPRRACAPGVPRPARALPASRTASLPAAAGSRRPAGAHARARRGVWLHRGRRRRGDRGGCGGGGGGGGGTRRRSRTSSKSRAPHDGQCPRVERGAAQPPPLPGATGRAEVEGDADLDAPEPQRPVAATPLDGELDHVGPGGGSALPLAEEERAPGRAARRLDGACPSEMRPDHPLAVEGTSAIATELSLAGREGSPTPLAGREGSPTPLVGHEQSPTPLAGREGSTTPLAGREGSATPLAGREGSPTPLVGHEQSPTPLAGREGSPTPLAGREGSPTPLAGHGQSPTPLAGREGSPTPLVGHEQSPTPLAGREGSPTPLAGREGSPTPLAGHGQSPTPLTGREGSPTPLAGREGSPTPLAGREGSPTPLAGRDGSPTPLVGHEQSPTPLAGYERSPVPLAGDGSPQNGSRLLTQDPSPKPASRRPLPKPTSQRHSRKFGSDPSLDQRKTGIEPSPGKRILPNTLPGVSLPRESKQKTGTKHSMAVIKLPKTRTNTFLVEESASTTGPEHPSGQQTSLETGTQQFLAEQRSPTSGTRQSLDAQVKSRVTTDQSLSQQPAMGIGATPPLDEYVGSERLLANQSTTTTGIGPLLAGQDQVLTRTQQPLADEAAPRHGREQPLAEQTTRTGYSLAEPVGPGPRQTNAERDPAGTCDDRSHSANEQSAITTQPLVAATGLVDYPEGDRLNSSPQSSQFEPNESTDDSGPTISQTAEWCLLQAHTSVDQTERPISPPEGTVGGDGARPTGAGKLPTPNVRGLPSEREHRGGEEARWPDGVTTTAPAHNLRGEQRTSGEAEEREGTSSRGHHAEVSQREHSTDSTEGSPEVDVCRGRGGGRDSPCQLSTQQEELTRPAQPLPEPPLPSPSEASLPGPSNSPPHGGIGAPPPHPPDTPTRCPTSAPPPCPTKTLLPHASDPPLPDPTDAPPPHPPDPPTLCSSMAPPPCPTTTLQSGSYDPSLPCPSQAPLPSSSEALLPGPSDPPRFCLPQVPPPCPTEALLSGPPDPPPPGTTDAPPPSLSQSPLPGPTESPPPEVCLPGASDTPSPGLVDVPPPHPPTTPPPCLSEVPTEDLSPGLSLVPLPQLPDVPSHPPIQAPSPPHSEANSPPSSQAPSPRPSEAPSPRPSEAPSPRPSKDPLPQSSDIPSPRPSDIPSPRPSDIPSPRPSDIPSPRPPYTPSHQVANIPSPQLSEAVSAEPPQASPQRPSDASSNHPASAGRGDIDAATQSDPRHLDPTLPVNCCTTTLLEVDLDVLQSEVLSLPGSRDRSGRALVILMARNPILHKPTCSSTQLAKILMYLYAISRNDLQERGLRVLMESHHHWPATVIWKALDIFQGTVPGGIHSILVLTGKESPLVKEGLPGPRVKVVTSIPALHEYVDPTQLTGPFGGSFRYSHQKWARFHQSLESLSGACRTSIQFLRSSRHQLEAKRLPHTQEEVAVLIEEDQTLMRQVLQDTRLTGLQQEGAAILGKLKREMATNSEDYRISAPNLVAQQ